MVGRLLFIPHDPVHSVTLREAFLLPSPLLPYYVSTCYSHNHIRVSSMTPMKFSRAGTCLSQVSIEGAIEETAVGGTQ